MIFCVIFRDELIDISFYLPIVSILRNLPMVDIRAKAGTRITEEAAVTIRELLMEVDTAVMQVAGNPPTEEHNMKILPDDTVKEVTVIKAMEVLKEAQKAVMVLLKVNMADPKLVTEALKEDTVDPKVKTRFLSSVRGHPIIASHFELGGKSQLSVTREDDGLTFYDATS